MGLMGKILGKSDSQIIKEEVRKEADRQAKLNMTIAEQYGALASCRDTFERVIAMDRLNALERREKRIGDAAQKSWSWSFRVPVRPLILQKHRRE